MKIMYLLIIPILVFVGLNYRQLYSAWAIRSETRRLEKLAEAEPEESQNPAPVEDRFHGKLSSAFWKFTTINGGGKVSNESAWHATEIAVDNGLTIQHSPDTSFQEEKAKRQPPAAERYNNATLIGGSGFLPTPSNDVVLKFTAQVNGQFYGTAGVVVQPAGTLQADGFFAKPFDMFGFAVVGKESSFQGINGSLCYLALNWIPVKVNALPVDTYVPHDYEIRLRWISKTEWLGTVAVDGAVLCEMPMPAFGPMEVHVWSDNFLVISQPRRWWEIAPRMDVKFQDSGEKQFNVKKIEIFEEPR
jgi:hypothetical protein